jgi:hypothetical protein
MGDFATLFESSPMWWWRKVHRANIGAELRARLELFGEDVLAHAVAAGEHYSKGPELDRLLRESRQEILEWLQERRDISEHRHDRLETVEWAILVFVFIGVILDVLLLFFASSTEP